MKQLGNLAIVCARRGDVSLQVYDHMAAVHVGCGPQRAVMTAKWDDDEAVSRIIHELNFGAYAAERAVEDPVGNTEERKIRHHQAQTGEDRTEIPVDFS